MMKKSGFIIVILCLLACSMGMNAQSSLRQRKLPVNNKKSVNEPALLAKRHLKMDDAMSKLQELKQSIEPKHAARKQRDTVAGAKKATAFATEAGDGLPTWRLDYIKSSDGELQTFTYDSSGRFLTSDDGITKTSREYAADGGYTETEITKDSCKNVYAYNDIGDQTLSSTYIKDGKGEWFLTEKTETQWHGENHERAFEQEVVWVDSLNQYVTVSQMKTYYDENDRDTLFEWINYVPALKASVVTIRYVYRYDENGNKILFDEYDFDYKKNVLRQVSHVTYSFDSESRQLSTKVYKFDDDGNMYCEWEVENDYTRPDCAYTEISTYYTEEDQNLFGCARMRFDVDEDGNWLLRAQYLFDGTNYNMDYKEVSVFDSMDRVLSQACGHTNADGTFKLGESASDVNKTTYSYEGDSSKYSETADYSLTSLDPETWTPIDKFDCTFNADGNYETITEYNYDALSQSFVMKEIEEYTYTLGVRFKTVSQYAMKDGVKVLTGRNDYDYDENGNRIMMQEVAITNEKEVVLKKQTYYSDGYDKMYYNVLDYNKETGEVLGCETILYGFEVTEIASASTNDGTKLSYNTDDKGRFTDVTITDLEGKVLRHVILENDLGIPGVWSKEVCEGDALTGEKSYFIPEDIYDGNGEYYSEIPVTSDYTDMDENTVYSKVLNTDTWADVTVAKYKYGYIKGKLAVSSYTTYDIDDYFNTVCTTTYRNDNFKKGEQGVPTLYSTETYDYDYSVEASDIAWNQYFTHKLNSVSTVARGTEQSRTDYVYTKLSDEPARPTAISSVEADSAANNAKVIKTTNGIIYNGKMYNFGGQEINNP